MIYSDKIDTESYAKVLRWLDGKGISYRGPFVYMLAYHKCFCAADLRERGRLFFSALPGVGKQSMKKLDRLVKDLWEPPIDYEADCDIARIRIHHGSTIRFIALDVSGCADIQAVFDFIGAVFGTNEGRIVLSDIIHVRNNKVEEISRYNDIDVRSLCRASTP